MIHYKLYDKIWLEKCRNDNWHKIHYSVPINHINVVIKISRIQSYYTGNKFYNYFSWKNTYFVLLYLLFGISVDL